MEHGEHHGEVHSTDEGDIHVDAIGEPVEGEVVHEVTEMHEGHVAPDGLVMDYVAPPNDILRMGGLIRRIPITAITMAIGGLSLAGFPIITAGFWSKDEILADAWHGLREGYGLPMFVLICLALSAMLTAFYTARMWFLAFWGEPRTAAAANAGEGSQSLVPPPLLAYSA